MHEKKPQRIVAVITADIIHSTRYTPAFRRRINTTLKRSFEDVVQKYPKAVHTRLAFRITAGDEFQCVISKIPESFDLLTYLRASTAISGIKPLISFRAAIGIGEIVVSAGVSPYEKDGKAFARARDGLEELGRRSSAGRRSKREIKKTIGWQI